MRATLVKADAGTHSAERPWARHSWEVRHDAMHAAKSECDRRSLMKTTITRMASVHKPTELIFVWLKSYPGNNIRCHQRH